MKTKSKVKIFIGLILFILGIIITTPATATFFRFLGGFLFANGVVGSLKLKI
jgi:hypothetical protein